MEGVVEKKKICGIKKLQNYCKSHMWCSLAMAILVAIILLMIIMWVYMKKQYYTHLVETTYTTEEALMNSVSINMKNQMETYINLGSGLSINEETVDAIQDFVTGDVDAQSNKDMSNALKSAARSSTFIVGIAVASEEGIIYQYDKNEMRISGSRPIWEEDSEETLKEVFSEIKEKNGKNEIPRYKIITHPMIHPNMESLGMIHITFPLKNFNSYQNVEYMMVVSFQTQPLTSFLRQMNQNQEEYIQAYIEDSDGEIMLHTQGTEYMGIRSSDYQEENQLTGLTEQIGNYGWTLHAVIDEEMLMKKVDTIYGQMVIMYAGAILVILLILFWTTNRILRPVNIISNSIKRVEDSETREQIAIEGTNEVWQLAQEYNNMLQKIRKAAQDVEEQHDKVIESLKMKQRAEREALESQINAHFICNTLNAINYEAMESGNFKVSILLKKLSNILRYTFDQKHQNVYMFQEISWIEQYLFLQRERLDNAFSYEIDFDSDYDNWPCRKLMLQPFVENSIVHGFEGMENGGNIKITGKGYKEFLE
ncbi:MAG TPA: histidine kinase, partial [Candidatus Blautia ornithocaccae]|nr:histidine kinase [Candidatus Blautia ornithocaccae]